MGGALLLGLRWGDVLVIGVHNVVGLVFYSEVGESIGRGFDWVYCCCLLLLRSLAGRGDFWVFLLSTGYGSVLVHEGNGWLLRFRLHLSGLLDKLTYYADPVGRELTN
ncbi:hypothetical protein NPIL_109211 [Nephila pilipes]|uniref:Uncharacterized protein n=1 Tax=Nephila pilipes TaxID=299642 RepID=A0A8X6MQ64_NEPPI|nr:hypothetical protein NPIL_109211 [Nephila pilipes]